MSQNSKQSKKSKKSKGFDPQKRNHEISSRDVLQRILDACLKSQEAVDQLLEQYQEKLTDNFALMVREEAELKIRQSGGKQKLILLNKLLTLSTYIYEFPRGNRASQLEIAIAIGEVLIKYITRSNFPTAWAMLQNQLGILNAERIRGDRSENLELAIKSYQNALEIYTRESFPESWGMTQNNLGSVYRDQEKFDLAIKHYQNALEIRTREASPEDWGMTQNNLGNVYYDQEKFDLAIKHYQNALEIGTRESFPEKWAGTQNNLGIAYCKASKYPEAITCLEAALEIDTRESFPENWAMTQYNLATVYRDLGNLDRAISYFRASLEIFAPTAFPKRRLQSGRDMGDAAFNKEKWQLAIEGYTAAIQAVEVSCSWASSDQHRSEIISKAIDIYTQTVQACLNNDQPKLALEYVERSKARNLVQLFSDLDNKSNLISKEVLQRLDNLKGEILAKQQELDNIPEDGAEQSKSIVDNVIDNLFTEDDDLEAIDEIQSEAVTKDTGVNLNQLYARQLRTRLEDLQQQFDQVLEEIIELDPAYALTQAVQPIRYPEIIDQIGDRTAIIEWYLTDQGFYTFLITKNSQQAEVWQFTSAEREQLDQWQRDYFADYHQDKYYHWGNTLESRLEELANLLQLKSILEKIPDNCNQLILVPHSYLHLLPLNALPIDVDQCLLDKFTDGVRYAPSCQLLQLSQKRSQADVPGDRDRGLFAIQNPTQDLNFASVEVKAIQQYFDDSFVLEEKNATKAAWKKKKTQKELQAANFIHFSCHSYFNFAAPLSSPLILSGSEVEGKSTTEPSRFIQSTEQQNYDLQQCLLLKEIFTLNLSPCRLVTLSACETGLTNPESGGDEYIGLPSGFLVAGSPSIVASQWAVSDTATAILMIKFYENLIVLDHPSVAQALNSAQLWLRSVTKTDVLEWMQQFNLDPDRQKELEREVKSADKEQPYAKPIYWAAFCAIGQ
ncbi:CHAT domain-containing protein [Crocosphaera sp.]|uniref:CHAT domain-containing protein n=1 Tax=Crocosphaera sp. TaxID=2729996 RepID=UPI00260AE77C|nr:CHAT domain-containing protein [Crocosphaera sp.]MDJ0578781.1 CHAT domain-containing protein [Crocosphaera sp.]